ncbi:Phd finger protein, partial [Striga asiatica]
MNGGGRRQRRRKSMAGCRGAAEPEKTDGNCDSPNLDSEITEKPSGFPDITKLPPKSEAELDLYTQARKALSLRSPFDSEDSQATPACVSAVSSLPSGVSHLLGRPLDSRKWHKKLHLGSEKKSSAPSKARGSNIWIETEEYFRELAIEDVERLYGFSSSRFSSDDKCFSIPYLAGDGNQRVYFDTFNRMLMNGSDELKSNGDLKINERITEEENMAASIDVCVDEVATDEFQMREESNEGKRLNNETDSTSFSGVEWLLGSRSKVYLASERPSKKRKLLGKDAGLEKLLVAHPVEGLESVCHYCSNGDMGNPLNLLIKCSSCEMVVHQRCYGVQDDVDSSWMCSWCKWKNVVELSKATPCMLCPKQGGALKPVQKRGFGSDCGRSKVEFAHLFCCLWIPEVYLENTRAMEPIMNVDELKETRRKLICHLCKVKHGACVRCSNGSCRMSFHPICAREARHRMEIWGKLGSDEVELRAFCTKHSEVECDSGTQDAEDVSLTADLDIKKLNDIVLDGEDLLHNRRNSDSHPEYGDPMHLADRNGSEDVNACGVFSFSMMLKKLIDLGKISSEDVASEIGVSLDSLDKILTDNHIVPELQCKLLRWLKNHVQIGNLQKTMKAKVRSLVAPKDVADVADGGDAVPVESNISDSVPVKSVPPRRRTKSSIRTVKGETNDGYVDSCVLVGEDSNDPSGESLSDGTKKILVDYEQHQDDSVENSIKFEDELRALVQFLSEDGLHAERRQSQQMTSFSPVLINGESSHMSYIHPFIYSKLMQTKKEVLERDASCQTAVLREREASQLGASSSSGLCCNNDNLQRTSSDRTSKCSGVDLDQLVDARNTGILKLSPADEVEGELLYYQHRIISNAVLRKHISDDLISRVVSSLPQEMDAAGERKWDALLVSQYHHELKEARKQSRKERRHKEAQAVLAAATAAAAASSRLSSVRKDSPEDSSQQEDFMKMNLPDVRNGAHSHLNSRVKETVTRLAVASSLDKNGDSGHLASSDNPKDRPKTCDVCTRCETVLNPVLVCSSCKVCSCVCSYGHCQASFHPTCARSAGFFMTLRTNGGKLQHKAYCGRHSADQRAKADTRKHGIEEFKSLKQVRRELVICSHNILASNRDTVLSALARHPFYQPEVSSESATTSIKGHTDDGCKSGSELVQRSDDVTVDSTVAGKRRVKIPVPVENDRKTDDSSTSQSLYMLKPMERVSSSGKQIPKRLLAASRNPSDDDDKRTKHRK